MGNRQVWRGPPPVTRYGEGGGGREHVHAFMEVGRGGGPVDAYLIGEAEGLGHIQDLT